MRKWLQKTSDGWHHQHFAAALSASLEVIKSNIITIVIFAALGSRQEDNVTLYLVGASFILVLLTGIVRWWTFTYQTQPGELRIKKGLLIRRDITLTRERIQVMDIAEGFIERIFGLVNVRVQTGSQQEAINLRALSKEEAKRVIQLVLNESDGLSAQSQTVPGSIRNGDSVHDPRLEDFSCEEELRRTDTSHHEETVEVKLLLSRKNLIFAAITSGGLGIALSILGTLYSQLEAVLGVSVVVNWVTEKAPILQQAEWSSILVLFILFFLIAWILSTSGFLLTNAGFVIRKYAAKLVISRGLIERKQTTLPFDRIQAVRFVEGVLRQPFGRGTLYAESAGFGSEQGSGSTLMFPILKKSELPDWMSDLLPGFAFEEPQTRLPVRALSRNLRRYLLPIAVVFGVIFARLYMDEPVRMLSVQSGTAMLLIMGSSLKFPDWMLEWAVTFFGIAGLTGGYSFIRWKSIRLGLFEKKLSTRTRRIAREESLIPSYRIQSLELTQSWLQKRHELCSLRIRIASGLSGRSFSLSDLEYSDGLKAVSWYREEIRSLRSRPPLADMYKPDSDLHTHHPLD